MHVTTPALAALLFARACIPPGGLTDPDEDYLTNGVERELGTDPHNADTDFDGLHDNVEGSVGTDPLNPDSDADALYDGVEVRFGLDPLAADGPADALATWLDASTLWRTRGDVPFAHFDVVPDGDPALWGVVDLIPTDVVAGLPVPTLRCVGTGLTLRCLDAPAQADVWQLDGVLDATAPAVLRFTLLRTVTASNETTAWVFNGVPMPTSAAR